MSGPTRWRSASRVAASGGAAALSAPKPQAPTSGPTVTSKAPPEAAVVAAASVRTSSSIADAGTGSVVWAALKRDSSESGA